MRKINVTSSNLKSVGYDDHSQNLEVEFHNGTTYRYLTVPKEAADKFMDDPEKGSHGSHLAKHIKGKFPVEKVEADGTV